MYTNYVVKKGGNVRRFIGLFIALFISFSFLNLSTSENKKANKVNNYLQSAKQEIAKGNIEKAKLYLEKCFRFDENVVEAKKLYSSIKLMKNRPIKETKSAKKMKYTVNPLLENKEVLAEEPVKAELPAVQKQKSSKGARAQILWEDFEGVWGPYGDVPPSGWTIIGNLPWGDDDWYNYNYGAAQGQVARVDYSTTEANDEWLITPSLIVPAEICSLKFWNYYEDYSVDFTDTGYVLGSINDGSTWPYTIAVFTTDSLGFNKAYDITSWAAGESQVKIAFHYLGDDDMWWYVDDCSVATYFTYQFDVGVTAILQPPDSVPQGRKTWTPRAVLHNFGTDRVRYFNFNCDIQSNNPFSDSYYYASWFDAGATDTITFAAWNPQVMGYDTMVAYHDLGSDMDSSNDTLKNEIKIVRSYFTGGPDTYGYSWIDSDTTGGPTYSWIGSSGSTPVTLGDDSNIKVELPFIFRFYENTYDSVYIVSNGYVSFDDNTSYSNGTIPSSGIPNNSIYVFWDDLNPSTGTVWYKTTGGSPNGFVVTWEGVPHLGETNGGSFQVILYDDGNFIIQYQDVNMGNSSYNFGRSATVGIENSGGTIGLQYENEGSPYGNLLFANRAIEHPCNDVPSPPIIYPLFVDLDGDFFVYWSPSIDRDGIAGYQLDEVTPDTLLYDQCVAGNFSLSGFLRSNTRSHSPPRSYGSENVSSAEDTMISVNNYLGAQSVEFWWWGGCESGIDRGYFDISTDNGTSWINMNSYTGNDSMWYHENVDVSSYSAFSILLRYRYHSDGSINYGGFWVDDILVNGWQWVQTFSSAIADTFYHITGTSVGWHYYHAKGEDNLNNWGNWGNIEDIWIGPNDAPSITVLTPANDTIITSSTYTIKWTDSDPDNDATISLYYDTDNTGYDGTLITSGISEDDLADSFVWNVGALNGRYYVYGKIDDCINAPVYDYSPGTITCGNLLSVTTDWLTMYISNDISDDPGTYTAATGAGHPDGVDITLLFGGGSHSPWSSYNTVRSYRTNTDYVTRSTGASTEVGFTVAQLSDYYTSAAYTAAENLDQKWVVDNGLDHFDVIQTIAAQDAGANSKLEITLFIVNHASENRTFSIRYEWDTHVNSWDSPAVRKYHSVVPDAWQITETCWTNSGIPLSLEETDDTLLAASIAHYLSVTEPMSAIPPVVVPDSLYYVAWSGPAYGNAFQVPYSPPDVLPFVLDDAVCYMWLGMTVAPNDTISVTQYLLVTNPALAITLTEFAANYIPNEHNIKIIWRTESEQDNLGFNVLRAIGEGEYIKINSHIIQGAGNSSSPNDYSFIDSNVKRMDTYYYKLEQIDINGEKQIYGPISVDIRAYIPLISSLQTIYPNPFARQSTTISFVVGQNDGEKNISIGIYDVTGRIVKTLVSGKLESGFYSKKWDARNEQGNKLSSGVYYAVLKTSQTTAVNKMVLIR